MFQKSTIWFVIVSLSLTACSNSSTSNSSKNGAGEPGAIAITGSTALLPLVKQAAQEYQQKHPAVKISVSGGGSRVGIAQVANKGVDIGDSDIDAPGEKNLVDHKVAVATFAVVVNNDAGVKSLSKKQLADVFSAKETNWKAVGGSDQKIVIINRASSSGTRAVFVQRVMNNVQPTQAGLTQDSSGTVLSTVKQTPGAVSYVATSYLKGGGLTQIRIDGVAPSDAAVMNNTYPFWAYEHMFTYGRPNNNVADFIRYVQNDKPLLKQLGFMASGDLKVK
ncbi:MAG: phosphate ABC transporter substrate-binding protein [Candidatus Eremiobacteraeota bacterium]|nr:phosphate ABC transporter substrate-binding protein [Candidatus Eremiobacteraeota bacterium]